MLESAWGWAKEKLEGLGFGAEVALILVLLIVGWYLGGPWFFAAILVGMALLYRGLK